MSDQKSRLIFFGNERLATGITTSAPILQALIDADYEIAAVVSHHEGGASRQTRDLEIAAIAAHHSIPLLLPTKPAEIIDQLVSYEAEAGVLIAYGKIVPQSVIDIFPQGIINIHPSLLPLHRGPTPLESVILDGSTETGVSVMKLAKEMDAGPVYGQLKQSLTAHETKQELADTLLHVGKELLLELLPLILNNQISPRLQDDSHASYDTLLTKADGLVDFTKPAIQLEREIRAYAGWPGSRTTIGGKDVTITQAHCESGVTDTASIIRLAAKQFGFGTSDGILVIDMLKPAGKAELTAAAFLTGYTHLLQD